MPNINGTSDDDSLSTGPGQSVVHGLGGDDYIYDTYYFSDFADELYGDEGDDQIYGRGGSDLLFGGTGDDVLNGGLGADTLEGGDDNDYLADYDGGGDTLRGGAGDDQIYVSHPTSATPLAPLGTLTTIEGGTGNDRITLNYARTAQTMVDAGEGDDHIMLSRSAGVIALTLGAGRDTVELTRNYGGWPLTGLHLADFDLGPGGDRLIGLSEFLFFAIGPWDGLANPFATNQMRLRQSGADALLETNFLGTGDAWNTVLSFDNVNASSLTAAHLDGFDPTGAAAAPQSLDGTTSGEQLYGGQGDDVVHGGDGDDILTGNAGNDALYGGDGDDELVGGVGTDLLDGGAGNDNLIVSANGADTVIGGDGDDILFYARNDRNFTVPTVIHTSHVDMGDGNDWLTIQNYHGDLIADAGAGDDTIISSGYGYRLTLGAGADAIQMNSASGTLTITDFNPAEDRFSSFYGLLHSWGNFIPGDPFANNLIRVVQQGADTAVQTSPFLSSPFTLTAILLVGVDANSLNAANFGGYTPDGVWFFGTSANDVRIGGAAKDRLSDTIGGSDTLDGAGGNDILTWSRTAGGIGTSHLNGGAGDDRINLSGGGADSMVYADGGADNDDIHLAGIAGRSIVTLGTGQDTITLDNAAAGFPAGGRAIVTDFQVGAGGDALALTPFLTAWLTGWNPADNPFATGHVRLAQSGTSTLLQFDRNGGGDAWTTVLTLENTATGTFTAANLGGWESGTFGNVAPALDPGPPGSEFVEGLPMQRLFGLPTLGDADSADFGGGRLTVSLAGATADDRIIVSDAYGPGEISVSGADVRYNGTVIGTLSGGNAGAPLLIDLNANATAPMVTTLIQSLFYVNMSDGQVGGQRVFTLDLTDGDGGTAEIVTEFLAVAVNDAPTIAGLDGDVAHYVEGGAPVRLDAGAQVLIGDADSANFDGGSLRVSIAGGGDPDQDVLDIQAGNGILLLGSQFGNAIAIDGFYVATISGGRDGADLVFDFVFGGATPAAVARLVQALTFVNNDSAPTVSTRTITLTLNDGDGTASPLPYYPGADTRVATVQVEVGAVNQAPLLTVPLEPTVSYYENVEYAFLFSGMLLYDNEQSAGYGGGSLTLSVGGGDGTLLLPSWSPFHAVANAGGFDLVYDNGSDPAALVGRIAGLGTASVVVDSFTAASPAIFSSLVSAFAYREAGDAPSAAPRTATLTFNDGGNGTGAGALSATRTQSIEIVPQNDAPILATGAAGPVAYTMNAAAVPLFQGLTITDPDQPASFAGGAMELLTGGPGAQFVLLGSRFTTVNVGGTLQLIDTVSGQQVGLINFAPGSVIVSFHAGATVEAVNALARSFGFTAIDIDGPPLLGLRDVSLILHDGGAGNLPSNTVYETVDVKTDWLIGTAGADMMTGTAGADKFDGGAGDDTYYVDHVDDRVIEHPGQGNDRIATSVSYTLSPDAHIERLEAGDSAGTGAMDLTGNNQAGTISGNNGLNILRGGEGNDTLSGYGGDDFLVGGGGLDAMTGGAGDDTFYVDNFGDVAFEAPGEGNDRIAASVSYVLSNGSEIERLEAVTIAATNAFDLTGSDSANFISGNNGVNILKGEGGSDTLSGYGGDDFLTGGTGADAMIGGGGNDTFYVDDAGDIAFEAPGEGNDRIAASVSYVLSNGSEIERLEAVTVAATTAFDLTGSDSVNFISGNNGVNVLKGEGGDDTLLGFGGDDFLVGGTGNDVMAGGLGNDTYYVDLAGDAVGEVAGEGNDRIAAATSYALAANSEIETLEAVTATGTEAFGFTGNALGQAISGNNGANVLDGKGGNDVLTGFGGADTFQFTSAPGAGNVDRITDFVSGTDKIALDDAVFTGLGLGALGAGAFVTGIQAQDANDRIIYNSATGALLFDADGNGAGVAVQFATLDGHPIVAAGDFIVI